MQTIGFNEIFFLLLGLKWTVALTIIGFIGGGIFGLLVASGPDGGERTAAKVTTGYIAIFQGTPLLMQLFVVYYGVALIGLNVDAWICGGDRLHAARQRLSRRDLGAGCIRRCRRVRTEAAKALGLHYVSRIKDVILPQALKISLPATVGFLVQLIKGTSLAAIVGFVELSRPARSSPTRRFRPITVFAIVGLIYFLICWPLSLWGARAERRLQTATVKTMHAEIISFLRRSKKMKELNTIKRRSLLALAAAAIAVFPALHASDAFAGTLADAKKAGKVVIGIQGDNSPWGFVNSSGGVQDGLDADIGGLWLTNSSASRPSSCRWRCPTAFRHF